MMRRIRQLRIRMPTFGKPVMEITVRYPRWSIKPGPGKEAVAEAFERQHQGHRVRFLFGEVKNQQRAVHCETCDDFQWLD